jgi:phage terminase large subunit GpA-like protein
MARLRAAVRDAWRPRRRERPSDWIARRVRLSDLEAAKGPYDLDGRPWWREILDAIGDPTVQTIAIPAATQVGKTLALCAAILYLAEHAPASALVVVPTEPDAREFRERLYRLAEASGMWIPPEGKWNMRHMQIGGMRIYLAWSGARQRLRGRRCKYVFLTEIDVYDRGRGGDPIESARQRVKAFPRHLILMETSPLPEISRIEEIEQQPERQRRRWRIRCPECGRAQMPRFFPYSAGDHAGCGGIGGITDGDGRALDPVAAREQAYYVCRDGCRIEARDFAEAMRTGAWAPEGCELQEGPGGEDVVVGHPRADGRNLGFHLWAAHSEATLGRIAEEWAKAMRDGGLPDWWGNWLGKSHKSRGALPTWRQMGERFASPLYRRGTVPADCWFLEASCDVQEREVYCRVRGWGHLQSSWLIDWYVFDRRPGDEAEVFGSDLAQLQQVLDAWYPVVDSSGEPAENPRGRKSLQVALLGIDANYRTLEVHEWIRSVGKTTRVRAVRGDGNMPLSQRYKKSIVKESKRERDDGSGVVVYQGGLELWSIAADAFRLWLVERFQGRADKPGAWLLPANVLESGMHYLKQLVNEPPKWIRGKDGRRKVIFETVDEHLGHDFWDCEVYGVALAQMVVDQLKGNPGWDATRWDRGEAPAEVWRPAAPDRAARPGGGDRSAR